MAVSIDYVHQLVYDLAAKQLASFPSPNDFNNYAELASIDLFNYYNDERNKELIDVKMGQTINIPNTLSDFVVYQAVMEQSGNEFLYPDDFMYDLALTNSVSKADFKKVDPDKIFNYINSTIDAPSLDFPIYMPLDQSRVVVYPTVIPSLTYLRKPITPVWAYTVINNRPVYDPLTSVDFDWSPTEVYRLTMRILNYFGISIRDTELMQEAQQLTIGAS